MPSDAPGSIRLVVRSKGERTLRTVAGDGQGSLPTEAAGVRCAAIASGRTVRPFRVTWILTVTWKWVSVERMVLSAVTSMSPSSRRKAILCVPTMEAWAGLSAEAEQRNSDWSPMTDPSWSSSTVVPPPLRNSTVAALVIWS